MGTYYSGKKKSSSIFTIIEVVIIGLFAVAIITMLIFFFMFSKDGSTPNFFGTSIILSNVTNMEPDIPKGAAVFGKPSEIDNLVVGDAAICKISNGTKSTVTILRIVEIQTDDTGTFFVLKGDTNPINETIRIPKADIIAKAESYSQWFGNILSFSTSQLGVLTVIVIPCLLLIVMQVIRILKMRSIDNDNDFDNDDYETDDVVFSTLNTEENFDAPPPVRRAYIGDEGKASYRKEPIANASRIELPNSNRSKPADRNITPFHSQSDAARQTNARRETVGDHFKQKPISPQANYSNKKVSYDRTISETLHENTYSKPVIQQSAGTQPGTRPNPYYERPAPTIERRLDPPNVQNPVDITIPTEAVKPRETIAPPPKQQNNKTVEELMRVIDQAQSKIK